MITKLPQLNQLISVLILSAFIAGCSSDDTPKAHSKATIDVLIIGGKVDVSVEKDGKVISEFDKVDSFRVETDIHLEAVLSSKSAGDTYLYIVPGLAAKLDKKGVEKIYVTLGSDKEKAASIKNEFDFELKLINRPISSFVTRYSHYEDMESFYQEVDESGRGRGHVWGNGVSAFEKRHQEQIIEKMELIDIFEYEFDLQPLFNSNDNPFLTNSRAFEAAFDIDSLFVIGIENEVLTVQLYGKWKLFNGFEECILTYPVKTFCTSGHYYQENIVDPLGTSEMEKVISEAFLSTLTNAALSEEFREHLTSAEKVRKQDSLKNLSLGKLTMQAKQASSSFENKLKENQQASVAIIGDGSVGSGSVISSDGYILTNYHVVGKIKDNIEVVFSDGSSRKAEIVRSDREIDVALLKIDSTGLFTTSLAPLYHVGIGEKVFTIATPQNLALINTVSFGHVSALREISSVRHIQSDGNFLNGTSGGPLFNTKGQQIGVNVLGWQNNGISLEGLNFAIPIDVILQRLNIQQ